jgi:hypothetical protein
MIKLAETLPDVAKDIKIGLLDFKAAHQRLAEKFERSNSKHKDKLTTLYKSIAANTSNEYMQELADQVDSLEVLSLCCNSSRCASFYTQAINKDIFRDKATRFLPLHHSIRNHLLIGIFVHKKKIIFVEYYENDQVRDTLIKVGLPIKKDHLLDEAIDSET